MKIQLNGPRSFLFLQVHVPWGAVMVLPLIVAGWKLVGILGSLSYVTNQEIGAIG